MGFYSSFKKYLACISKIHKIKRVRLLIGKNGETAMKVLITMLLWGILLVLCWPIALIMIILWPIVWLLSIPFRIVGIAMEGFLAVLKAILFLPARILGYKDVK